MGVNCERSEQEGHVPLQTRLVPPRPPLGGGGQLKLAELLAGGTSVQQRREVGPRFGWVFCARSMGVRRMLSDEQCTFNLLKQARRFATRYEKTVRNYAAVVAVGCAMLWLRI